MTGELILIAAAALAVVLSGLFSGAETGIYRLSRLRLRLGVEKRHLSFVLLGRCMRDGTGVLLSVLVGTNLSNYLCAAVVTSLLLERLGSQQSTELLVTVITAPILFIFGELIPKNIFFYRADRLMPVCGPLLYVFHKALTFSGVIAALKGFTRLCSWVVGAPLSAGTAISDAREHHIAPIIRETREEGLLNGTQVDIINRIVTVSGILLRSVMIPIGSVETVPRSTDKAALLRKLRRCNYTRLPVYEGSPADIVGFVNVYEALSSGDDFHDLGRFVKPILRLSGDTSVWKAIDIMKEQKQKIVLVTAGGAPGRKRILGLATMKDLAEELLGELAEW